MKILFLEEIIPYTGSILHSHWIYKKTALKDSAMVSFVGPCDVGLDAMVDLEDVKDKRPIFSKSMLHFIAEHFESDLTKMILYQRLLMTLIQEELNSQIAPQRVVRRGDDLFLEEAKLTVSIATASPVSCLLHAGINIVSEGTPVVTLGLDDLTISPQAFARGVMNRYVEEFCGIAWARSKVRGVP